MYKSRRTSKSPIFPLILLLLISPFTLTTVLSENDDVDDLEGIEELIAIDDEQETGGSSRHANYESKEFGTKSEVLSKAQRLVLELNSDSTKRIIEENEYVMVLGYAPWCSRSAELMPRFAEAANVLKGLGSGILLAKIDAERYPKAASDLGIKGFPTLLLFVNGSSRPYTGGFSSEEIVIWARKKTGAPVNRINSIAEANEFLKKHAIYAVGLFDQFEVDLADIVEYLYLTYQKESNFLENNVRYFSILSRKGAGYEEFVKAAAADNDIQFLGTSNIEVAKVLYPIVEPTKPFFGLVKSEPEQYTPLDGNFTLEEILHFLENNKFPLVTVMTELNSAKVYSSPNKLQVYVFAEADDLTKLLEPLREVAKKFKSQIMFTAADIGDNNLAKPFLTLFGLEESEDTMLIAFDYNSNSKYLLESDLTSRNIEDFCTALVQRTLSPYFKSQSIPDNTNASIVAVVGKTFDDLVLNSPANIVLEVHTPWCITCETTSKHMEKLAKHFKGLDNLIFARIDASTNEHPKLQVEDYPSLLFYPANDKSNPVKLPTKSNLKDLAALINKNLKAQGSVSKDEL